jgi:GxxExxY protein
MLIHKEKQKLGELLRNLDLLNEEQVKQALLLQREQGIKFGDAVVTLGFLKKDDINWALSNQLNIPYIPDLKEKGIVDPASVALLPYDFAEKHCVIILGQMSDAVNIVIADPLNSTVIEYIEHSTGKHVNVSISDEQAIRDMIEVLYKDSGMTAAEHHGEGNVAQIKTEIDTVIHEIGTGFDAEIYKNALCISFDKRAKKNVSIQLSYKNAEIGKYFIDIVIDNAIGVIFSNRDIDEHHINALLKLSKLQGLIVMKIAEKLTLEALE